jgi:thioesterase domain-containing protein
MLGFRRIAELLPSNQPAYGLHVYFDTEQLDGQLTISALAQSALNRIRELQPAGRITMIGHSAGGLIVFEAARRILEAGDPEPRVLLMDSTPPPSLLGYYWGESVLYWSEVIRNPVTVLRGTVTKIFQTLRLRESRSPVTSQADDLMTLNERHLKSIETAVRRYRTQEYGGSITVMRTRQGRVMAFGRRYLGWASATRGALKVIDAPGSHINMLDASHVNTVAEKLIDWLSSE